MMDMFTGSRFFHFIFHKAKQESTQGSLVVISSFSTAVGIHHALEKEEKKCNRTNAPASTLSRASIN